jgi:hypothetical protein
MKYSKIIIVNILILFSLLLVGELTVRILKPNLWLYKRSNPNEFQDRAFDKNNIEVYWPKKDNDLGWVCKQDSLLKFSSKYYNNYPIVYRINKEGFRNCNDFESHPNIKNKKRLLLLGDSFIMSVYLNEDKTIAHNLQNSLKDNYEVINLGIPGYGIDQSTISYEKYSKLLHPDVVIFFYVDDDIPRILEAFRKVEGMNKPSYDLINDSLHFRISKEKSIVTNLLEHSYLLNRFYKKYMDYYSIKLAEKLFLKLIKMTKEQKQKLIIVRCPVVESLLTNNSYQFYSFKDFFRKQQIEYYELYDRMIDLNKNFLMTLYLKNDGHPSERGAKYLANAIYDILIRSWHNTFNKQLVNG